MRSHGNGHHAPIEETLAFLAPYRPTGDYTWITLGSGLTVTVTPMLLGVNFDSSLTTQAQPVATLNAGKTVGEEHTFVWYGWGNMDTPPLIQGAAGVLMMPFA